MRNGGEYNCCPTSKARHCRHAVDDFAYNVPITVFDDGVAAMGVYGKAVLERLRDALRIPNARGAQVKLAHRLGITRAELFRWQSRDQVGFVRVLDVCDDEGFDANWILFGKHFNDLSAVQFLDIQPPTDEIMELDQIAEAIQKVRSAVAARKGSA